MYSFSVLILYTLLQVGGDGAVPRQPLVQQTPFVPATPPIAPVQTPPPADPPVTQPTAPPQNAPNQLRFTDGLLALPKWNHVKLSATERAVLKSLKTEQRDAQGNVLRDIEGNPVMIPVREGMYVSKGQPLGNFEDRELRSILKINQAQLEVAKAEQGKSIEEDYAARSLQVAMAEVNRMRIANRALPNTFPEAEVHRAMLAQDQAHSYLELQKYNTDEIKTREVVVRESELERTEGQIADRKLIATIAGMIVNVQAAEGEWLREGDPVLEIVQLETLLVRKKISASEYAISDFDGKRAVIRVPLSNGRVETFQGMVIFCNPLAEAGDTFEVNIEVQNRRVGNYWLLQPGLGKVEIVIPL